MGGSYVLWFNQRYNQLSLQQLVLNLQGRSQWFYSYHAEPVRKFKSNLDIFQPVFKFHILGFQDQLFFFAINLQH